MDRTHPPSDRIRRIERGFEASRLAPHWIVAAYANLLPVVRLIGIPASPRRRDGDDSNMGRVDARHVMGA